jgi:probable F420-dependent oxidoreductase
MVLPYHNPVALAKYVATLDHMSNGRVILGVGVGAMTAEFEALGISMRQRGALTNENIAVMRELWTSQDPEFDSQRWHFADLKFAPKPKQKPHVPLWIGGASPGAIKRTATIGDGWHPTGLSPDEFRTMSQELRQMAVDAGRGSDTMTMSMRVEVEAHGGPSSDRARNRARLPGDDIEMMIDAIRAYESAGVEHMVLALNTGDVGRITELMQTIASRVIPQFR